MDPMAVKPRLVLHIGMHKTGSSSIQHRLASVGSNTDFNYLDLGRGPNHSGAMFAAFSSTPESYHFFKRRGYSTEDVRVLGETTRDLLARQLGESGASTRIISGEDITTIDPEGLARLRDFLSPLVGSILVFAYARSPKSFMESAFQQRVKGGLGSLSFPPLYPMYRKRFEKFEQVFGKQNVQLSMFDPQQFPRGDVAADFCQRLGIGDLDGSPLNLNQSLSRRAVALLYTYRKFGSAYGSGMNEIRDNKALVWALSTLAGSKLSFSGEQLDEVLQRFANDRRWAESRIGARFEDVRRDSADDVRDEACLFRYDQEQVEWLGQWLPGAPIAQDMSPQQAAATLQTAMPAIVERYKASKASARA